MYLGGDDEAMVRHSLEGIKKIDTCISQNLYTRSWEGNLEVKQEWVSPKVGNEMGVWMLSVGSPWQ